MFNPTLLNDRTVIQASGKDAARLLQGLLTCNIEQLDQGALTYGFLLTPQGRFLHEFFIFQHDKQLYLDTHTDRVEDLLKRFKLYTLKSDAKFTPFADWGVFATATPHTQLAAGQTLLMFHDPRHHAMGGRCYGPVDNTTAMASEEDTDGYHAHRIFLGIPSATDFMPEKTLLLDYDIDQLGGIDFDKGCYVGQEVTARMHYRNVDKKGIYLVTSINKHQKLPHNHCEIMVGEHKAGRLLSAVGTRGIAVLRHEYADGTLIADTLDGKDVALKATRPDWIHKE